VIHLYTAPTPNGIKVSIALEELELPYRVVPVNLRKGEQLTPEFLRISPNNKIPAIVDDDGPDGREMSLFESGAILVYLADKTGKLLPASGAARYRVLEWVFFQVGNIGPMFGQANHFRRYASEKVPYAIERYTNEVKRLLGVVDRQLGQSRYLAGDEYTIADIINVTWLFGAGKYDVDLAGSYPNAHRWIEELNARPAVARGREIPPRDDKPFDAAAKEVLFGKTQYERR
jgi:GST-like protein